MHLPLSSDILGQGSRIMHRHHALLFSLAVLGGLPTAGLALPGSVAVPPDSFINQHVSSLSQMSQQVTLDPVVRRRLARHFHTSGPAVVRYIQKNLVLKKTTMAQRYQVYCISHTGREYTINSRLPIGTPVFVMRSTGKPILKLACGNPMVAELPPVKTKVGPYTSPELANLPKPGPAPILPGLSHNGPVVVAMNSGPGVVVTPAPITQVGGVISSLPIRGGHFPIGLLAGIPIIAGITSHGGNNGSPAGTGTGTTGTGTGTTGTGTGTTGTGTGTTGTGTGTTGTGTGTTGTGTGTTGTGTTGPGPGPVPEPSTSAAFAVGAAGLVYLLNGTRRRRKTAKN